LVVTLALARGLSASLPCALSWPAWQGQTLMTGLLRGFKIVRGRQRMDALLRARPLLYHAAWISVVGGLVVNEFCMLKNQRALHGA